MRNNIIDFKFLHILLLLFFSTWIVAQSNQTITDTIANGWIEKYSVLREGSNYTKHGKYQLLNPTGQQIISGNYKLGKKTGKWEFYDTKTTVLIAEGSFDLDKPIGFWEYYNSDGETWLIYSFDKEQVDIFQENKVEHSNHLIIEYFCDKNEYIACQPEQKPQWLSPYDPFTYLQIQSLRWNKQPEENLWQELILDFSIDAYGKLYNITCTGISKEWEIPILESMKNYLPHFIPAEIGGSLDEISIRFQIKKD
jgi:hypothetical protein